MKILLQNVTAVTMDPAQPVLKDAFVAVEGTKIASVGTARPQGEFDRVIEMCIRDSAQPQPAPDPVEETVSEIDDNVQRLLNQAMLEATAENLKARQEAEEEPEDLEDTAEFGPVSGGEAEDEDEEDLPPVRGSRINFGELQFGRDYEIK